MEKEIFRLDRNGGRDKIVKATYSPRAYRQEHKKPERLSAPKLILAWVIILGIVFGVAYVAEKRGGARTLVHSR